MLNFGNLSLRRVPQPRGLAPRLSTATMVSASARARHHGEQRCSKTSGVLCPVKVPCFKPAPGKGQPPRPPRDAVASGASSGPTMTHGSAYQLASSTPLAGGKLDVVHWRGERMLRIWTPPGYSLSDAAREPYPVLYLNDGQNLFGDKPTLSGQSWRAAETAVRLIRSGVLPPFVIVGVDHAGVMRSYDYLPYPPGSAGGYRLDAEKWPGGGVDAYLRAVVDEILPYAERSYGVSPDPSLRGFGGSSFGGICALCCALRHPGVFGSLLVESPSLWFADERLLREDLPRFQGPWPDRVFLAMGTQEYSGIRQLKAPEFDAKLVSYTHELAGLLESKGLARDARLAVVVEEAASHTESAWAGRLPTAMTFMGRQWKRGSGSTGKSPSRATGKEP